MCLAGSNAVEAQTTSCVHSVTTPTTQEGTAVDAKVTFKYGFSSVLYCGLGVKLYITFILQIAYKWKTTFIIVILLKKFSLNIFY